jgi:hypothetical protein
VPHFDIDPTRPGLHHLPDDAVIGPLRLEGATLIDRDKSIEQFAQCPPLALTIHTLQVADPFTVASLCNLAIGCA